MFYRDKKYGKEKEKLSVNNIFSGELLWRSTST